MKNGFRVYDTDTHIDPGADVLERYVDPGFRKRLDDLAPYRVAIKSRTVDGGIRHTYRFDQRLYERTLGEAESRPGTGDGRVNVELDGTQDRQEVALALDDIERARLIPKL